MLRTDKPMNEAKGRETKEGFIINPVCNRGLRELTRRGKKLTKKTKTKPNSMGITGGTVTKLGLYTVPACTSGVSNSYWLNTPEHGNQLWVGQGCLENKQKSGPQGAEYNTTELQE